MGINNSIQILLDSILMSLCCIKTFQKTEKVKSKDLYLIPIYSFIFLITRVSVSVSEGTTLFLFDHYGYEILPAHDLFMLLFLFLVILIMNSIWFPHDNGYTFFGTLAAFTTFIMLREICVILFHVCKVTGDIWYLYICRILSIILACLLLKSIPFHWIKDNLKDGNRSVRLMLGNTFIILVLLINFFSFNLEKIRLYFPVITGTLTILIIVDCLLMIYEQKRIQERKKIATIEQYIPVIEELITQVRARQHEYNNRLLAISAAVTTSETLKQAQEKVMELIQGIQISNDDYKILTCDSKVIGGMIYGKKKQAEMQRMKIQVEINALFNHSTVLEADWVEIIGILLDNAIEASLTEDTILLKADELDGSITVLVSNAHEAISNTQFMQMFRRGFTTKKNYSNTRGHGLANVRELVDHYHGKIITRNEMQGDSNYVTIGVILS